MPTTARIIWDETQARYVLATPFEKDFIDAFKEIIHWTNRAYSKDDKIWVFDEPHLDDVVQLCHEHFDHVVVEKRGSAGPVPVGPLQPSEALEFLALVGLEAATAAYRAAMKRHHTDTGGDHEKASRTNVLWDRLKKEVRWT